MHRRLHSPSKCLVWVKKCCHIWLDQILTHPFWPGPKILTGSVSNDYLIDSVSNYNLVDQDCLTNILGIVWWLSDDFLMTTLLKQYNGLSFQNWKNPKICWNLLEVLFSQIALIGKTWSVSANKNIWPLITATNKSHK